MAKSNIFDRADALRGRADAMKRNEGTPSLHTAFVIRRRAGLEPVAVSLPISSVPKSDAVPDDLSDLFEELDKIIFE